MLGQNSPSFAAESPSDCIALARHLRCSGSTVHTANPTKGFHVACGATRQPATTFSAQATASLSHNATVCNTTYFHLFVVGKLHHVSSLLKKTTIYYTYLVLFSFNPCSLPGHALTPSPPFLTHPPTGAQASELCLRDASMRGAQVTTSLSRCAACPTRHHRI